MAAVYNQIKIVSQRGRNNPFFKEEKMSHCVLLNADYTFLNVIDWKRAMCLVTKGKIEVLRYSEKVVRCAEGAVMKIPIVMRLIKLVRSVYKARIPFSKKNILIRDSFKCVYCGTDKGRLTIDHIIPRSRGGKSTFENCVSCCRECNNKKGAKTPIEAGMFMKHRPYQPTISEFLRLKVKKMGINDVLKDLGVY